MVKEIGPGSDPDAKRQTFLFNLLDYIQNECYLLLSDPEAEVAPWKVTMVKEIGLYSE